MAIAVGEVGSTCRILVLRLGELHDGPRWPPDALPNIACYLRDNLEPESTVLRVAPVTAPRCCRVTSNDGEDGRGAMVRCL